MTRHPSKTSSLRSAAAGLLAGASIAALAFGAPSHALNPQPAPISVAATTMAAQGNLADIVERVSPSVVQILVRSGSPVQTVAAPEDFSDLPPQLRDFFGPNFRNYFTERPNLPRQMPDRMGSGSGFFIHDGYIVTNNHVVDNAKKLRVRLDDGLEVEGTLVGTDAKTDLAVIKVEARHARKALSWGDSNRTRVGDNVFTIGAPFSLGNTVTAGIVSARGRNIGSGPYDDYLQIDAPINPGNSGGPMFNAAGEVIGVNTAIYSPSGGSVGIGFSIPSDQARSVVQQIIDRGYVERGWLGVQIQRVTPEIAQSLGLGEGKGALVAEVTPDSPASKAGLRSMDLITSFAGQPVATMQDLTRAVADTRPGASRDLKVWRDGRERTISVRIEALEAPAEVRLAGADDADKVTLNGGLGLQIMDHDAGPVIAAVIPGSPAEEAGLRAGDRLLRVGERQVTSVKAAQDAVLEAKSRSRAAVLVQVERNGSKLFVGVPLSSS